MRNGRAAPGESLLGLNWQLATVLLLGLGLLVPLVVVPGTFFPYVVPRNVLFRVVVELAAVVLVARITVGGKRHVKIAQILPIGNYAIRPIFDDGHDSGIFTWVYLHELGVHGNEKWAGYLAELTAKGLGRG